VGNAANSKTGNAASGVQQQQRPKIWERPGFFVRRPKQILLAAALTYCHKL
jgi:hypothetical protein